MARNANLVPANAREVVVADASASLVPANAREVADADAVNYKKYLIKYLIIIVLVLKIYIKAHHHQPFLHLKLY